MKKLIIIPVLMSMSLAFAEEAKKPKTPEELRLMVRNQCAELGMLVEQVSIVTQLENTDQMIKMMFKPDLLSGIHGNRFNVKKENLRHQEARGPELRNVLIYAGATGATQNALSEEEAKKRLKESNDRLEVHYKEMRKMFQAAQGAGVTLEKIVPASDFGFLSGLHFDNYYLTLPKRHYLNVEGLKVLGKIDPSSLDYNASIRSNSIDLIVSANLTDILADNAEVLFCKDEKCFEEESISKLKLNIKNSRGNIPFVAKFKVYWNQKSAQLKLVSSKLNAKNASYTYENQAIDQGANTTLELPNLSRKLTKVLSNAIAQDMANQFNSAIVNKNFSTAKGILEAIKSTKHTSEGQQLPSFFQLQISQRADACAIKAEEINFNLAPYLDEAEKSAKLYLERQMQSQAQVIKLLNEKSTKGLNLEWEILETMTVKELNQILSDPTVGNLVIAAHAAQNGSLMDSNLVEIPERVFENISPTIRSLSIYSCHDGLVRKKYKLEEKMRSQPSLYENRMVMFPVTINFMGTPESAPMMALNGFLQKLETLLDLRQPQLASESTQVYNDQVCTAYLMNDEDDSEIESRLNRKSRRSSQFQVLNGSYMFSLNGKTVGVIEPGNQAALEFSCALLKDKNVVINQDITTELNSSAVNKPFSIYLHRPGQETKVIKGQHFLKDDKSYRRSKFTFDL